MKILNADSRTVPDVGDEMGCIEAFWSNHRSWQVGYCGDRYWWPGNGASYLDLVTCSPRRPCVFSMRRLPWFLHARRVFIAAVVILSDGSRAPPVRKSYTAPGQKWTAWHRGHKLPLP
jgi:hypothetical protein